MGRLINVFSSETNVQARVRLSILTGARRRQTLLTNDSGLIEIALIRGDSNMDTGRLARHGLGNNRRVGVLLRLSMFGRLCRRLDVNLTLRLRPLYRRILLSINVILSGAVVGRNGILT